VLVLCVGLVFASIGTSKSKCCRTGYGGFATTSVATEWLAGVEHVCFWTTFAIQLDHVTTVTCLTSSSPPCPHRSASDWRKFRTTRCHVIVLAVLAARGRSRHCNRGDRVGCMKCSPVLIRYSVCTSIPLRHYSHPDCNDGGELRCLESSSLLLCWQQRQILKFAKL
jgi:hypothetical protein